MGSAQGRFGQLDSRGAVPPERTALERLAQSQQQMQRSMQQIAQRGQIGDVPMARLFRQGGPGRFLPFGSLTPLPGCRNFPSSTLNRVSPGSTRKSSACTAKEE